MENRLETLVTRYRALQIDKQIDYDKFYLYSLITHSTAIEGSTITELENQIMFDHGVSLKGKSIEAYKQSVSEPEEDKPLSSREKIIALLAENGKHTTASLAREIGITAKAVEKHLARLKADGIIERIGPAKGGWWKVK